MARVDYNNKTSVWKKPEIHGVIMMHADFKTHSFAPHFHEEYVIAVTEVGGAEYTNKGISRYAHEDTVLVFNPGEPHSGRMGESKRWRYRSFYVQPDVFDEMIGHLGEENGGEAYFTDSKLKNSSLAKSLLNLHLLSEINTDVLATQEQLLTTFASLLKSYSDPAVKEVKLGREQKVVDKTREFLLEHYADDVSLKDLAALSSMSTFHLIRCFNKAIGLSPHAYLTQVRLKVARELLSYGEAPAEVAAAVGFYDQSALTRHFKRAYGATPKQFSEAVS